MINKFNIGDRKTFIKIVNVEDAASFEGEIVHPVYATFALARDAEWVCRLFVLDIKEEDEEGMGISLSIEHLSPAKIGEEVLFEASINEIRGNTIVCDYKASVGNRIIAKGLQGQKILKKEKIKRLLNNVK